MPRPLERYYTWRHMVHVYTTLRAVAMATGFLTANIPYGELSQHAWRVVALELADWLPVMRGSDSILESFSVVFRLREDPVGRPMS
ncbi:hypothetical protein GDO78_007290 [Eleutherodactylus coqui]|uniref:Uncharacterized protein n=1 Tax=Eleutherodactylus coqui TaxID=57060 RepID=A0A8J6FI02_ELECQ|nr:hypothetical protein GDO78_007290 [Eleutherodactylus coqui]